MVFLQGVGRELVVFLQGDGFWTVVVVALLFDFTNGFHDTATAVATSVSTRALSPRAAVLLASVFNFAGAFVSTAVATAVGRGIVDLASVTNRLVLAALLGALGWNVALFLATAVLAQVVRDAR